MTRVVCVAALRSPMGRFGGTLRALPVYDLGAAVLRAALSAARIDGGDVDETVVGCCRQAGNGPNPARTAAVRAGIPERVPALTVNMACPSGLKAIEMAAARIAAGEARITVAGGMESMSTMPYLLKDARWDGFRMGDRTLLDGWSDSRDPLCGGNTMGETAETLNEARHISREAQDDWAARSHLKAHAAWEEGAFDAEVVAVEAGKTTLTRDETIRHPLDRERLAALAPAFRQTGTVTPGNACGLSDGAAFLVLMSEGEAKRRGLASLATVGPFLQAGVAAATMGDGPGVAIPALLRRMKLAAADVDLYEINEAFAVQVLANMADLDCAADKVNVHGGAIALGHPTGCSGARIAVTLIHALRRHGLRRGVASLCGAGGVTMAGSFERSAT